jgi:hypothetical protein
MTRRLLFASVFLALLSAWMAHPTWAEREAGQPRTVTTRGSGFLPGEITVWETDRGLAARIDLNAQCVGVGNPFGCCAATPAASTCYLRIDPSNVLMSPAGFGTSPKATTGGVLRLYESVQAGGQAVAIRVPNGAVGCGLTGDKDILFRPGCLFPPDALDWAGVSPEIAVSDRNLLPSPGENFLAWFDNRVGLPQTDCSNCPPNKLCLNDTDPGADGIVEVCLGGTPGVPYAVLMQTGSDAIAANELLVGETIVGQGKYKGVTGDIGLDASGATIVATIQGDAVALGPDTTGNFLGSLACGDGMEGCPNAAEAATGTLATSSQKSNFLKSGTVNLTCTGSQGPGSAQVRSGFAELCDKDGTRRQLCTDAAVCAGYQAAFGSQSANLIFAGPASGGSAPPGFRASVAADFPAQLNSNARVEVLVEGVSKGTRRGVNLVAGSGIQLAGADNAGAERVDVTVTNTGEGGGGGAGGSGMLPFGSLTRVPASTTVFLGPGGTADQAELVVETPVPAMGLKNLRCFNGPIQGVGHDITATLRVGTCGALSSTAIGCTLTGDADGNQACTDVDGVTLTANQCVTLSYTTPGTLTAPAAVNCMVEVVNLNPVLPFGTGMLLPTGTATVYLGPGTGGDVSEAIVALPQPAASYKNLRCVPSHTPGGTGITVTARAGTCGSLADAGSPSAMAVTVTTASTPVTDTTNTVTATAGQCLAFKAVTNGTTTKAAVACTVERIQ